MPANPVRFVTATALFDGHDAAINIMRRILQAQGAEVDPPRPQPLGRSEVVDAVLEEDAQGVAVSSYQGGHVEYFEYLVESPARARRRPRQGLRRRRRRHRPGGDRQRSPRPGCAIFSPEDGQRLGLPGMINELIRPCDADLAATAPPA